MQDHASEVVQLFDELRAPLLRYLIGFGLTTDDGEEIAQEVFLALHLHLLKGKPRDNLRGWIFRVAHNLGLRRRARTRRDAGVDEDAREVHDPSPTPEVSAYENQERRRVVKVVDALPEQDRQCLMLRAEGLRYREIAEVLEMSLGSVASSLSRSLMRISRAR